MNIRTALTAALVLASTAACGGSEPPSISNLQFSPTTVTVGQQSTITGTFDFTDAEGDADRFSLKISTPAGQSQTLGPSPAPGTEGKKSGTVAFAFIINAIIAGSYPFEIWLVDADDNQSDHLSGTIAAQ